MAGAAALAITAPLVPASASAVAAGHGQIEHVLLISVDGMHQSDLEWYVANHPDSELARLATGGAEYTSAQTPDPSDSDPGGTALITGGDPKITGIYYDDEYSHGVFPPGTTNCSGPVPGGDVIYDSPDDSRDLAARCYGAPVNPCQRLRHPTACPKLVNSVTSVIADSAAR